MLQWEAIKAVLKVIWPLLVLIVVFLFGHRLGYVSASRAHDKYVAHQAELAADAAKEAAERVAQIEQQHAIEAKEIEDALQAKLDTATASARSLSERLRHYQTRRCPTAVPQTPSAAPVTDAGTGVPEDGGAVGEATDAHFAACARDAERLAKWQKWYNGLLDEK